MFLLVSLSGSNPYFKNILDPSTAVTTADLPSALGGEHMLAMVRSLQSAGLRYLLLQERKPGALDYLHWHRVSLLRLELARVDASAWTTSSLPRSPSQLMLHSKFERFFQSLLMSQLNESISAVGLALQCLAQGHDYASSNSDSVKNRPSLHRFKTSHTTGAFRENGSQSRRMHSQDVDMCMGRW